MNYSPLRYPGGKSKFSPVIKSLISNNGLVGCHYIEPYAGGAGVALSLLFDGFVSSITINDIDFAVYAFWSAIVNDNDNFVSRVLSLPVSMDTWHQKKEILENHANYSLLDIAVATFFLNRTNRSGILKAGVIGGKEQSGNYKLDARYNLSRLIPKIKKIGAAKSCINVSNIDAKDLIKNVPCLEADNTFIYLDPPYYVKGQGLYRNYYEHNDHVEIMNSLKGAKFRWVVSYDDNKSIRDIYKGFRVENYSLNYSAHVKSKGSEVVIYSPNLLV